MSRAAPGRRYLLAAASLLSASLFATNLNANATAVATSNAPANAASAANSAASAAARATNTATASTDAATPDAAAADNRQASATRPSAEQAAQPAVTVSLNLPDLVQHPLNAEPDSQSAAAGLTDPLFRPVGTRAAEEEAARAAATATTAANTSSATANANSSATSNGNARNSPLQGTATPSSASATPSSALAVSAVAASEAAAAQQTAAQQQQPGAAAAATFPQGEGAQMAQATAAARRQPVSYPPQRTVADQRLQRIYDSQQQVFAEIAANPDMATAAQDQRLQNLVNQYQSLLLDNPDYVYGYIMYGKLLRTIGERTLANMAFMRANALNPNLAVVKQQIANFLSEEGGYDLALPYYLAAVELEPQTAVYHYQLGSLLALYRNDFLNDNKLTAETLDRQMQDAFAAAARLEPQNALFARRYAESFFDVAEPDWQQALALWEKIEAAETDQLQQEMVRLFKARVLIATQRNDEARAILASVTQPLLQQGKRELLSQLNDAPQPPQTDANAPAPVQAPTPAPAQTKAANTATTPSSVSSATAGTTTAASATAISTATASTGATAAVSAAAVAP